MTGRREGWSSHWAGPIYTPCSSGKTGWAERSQAKKALRQMTGSNARTMSAYRCDECGNFHVGHLARPVRRGMSER